MLLPRTLLKYGLWKFVNKLQLPAVFLQDLLHLVSSNALMFLQKRNRKTRKT